MNIPGIVIKISSWNLHLKAVIAELFVWCDDTPTLLELSNYIF